MSWTSFIGPAVVSAVISSIVAWLTTSRRFALDRELTDRKVNADIALAEKKFVFDRAFTMWRRRYELVEQVLTAAYEAREALSWARHRIIHSGEGESRIDTKTETDELRKRRNSYSVPLERLARNVKSFATLQTLRYTVSAHFGPELVKPIAAFTEVHNEITNAAQTLIEHASVEDHNISFVQHSLQPFRDKLWGERPDEMDTKIDAAIAEIEAICRSVLSQQPPA